MIITLGGTPGSGKSTIGKILAEKLNYEFLSMGQIRRKYALDKGMSLEELNELAKTNPESDKLVDEFLVKLGKQDKLIIDGRLGWYFIPSSFKIWIAVSEEEGARRIFSHERVEETYNSEIEIINRNKERIIEDKNRYKELYNIEDYTSNENYDLILDTSNITAEEASEIILEEINGLF